MKELDLKGITYISQLDGTADWYFGISYEHGDLYEAEEIYKAGRIVEGRNLCLIRYPEGEVFWPLEKKAGTYPAEPVFYKDGIYILLADFNEEKLRVLKFSCSIKSPESQAIAPSEHDPAAARAIEVTCEIPLSSAKDCYNLMLHTSPLCITRQGGRDGLFEILWPERISFTMGEHESFFLRDNDRLYFNKWYEDGPNYWEETVVRNLSGDLIETLPGDIKLMPDGSLWHTK